jgi:FMN phosphatase YigB (HAD superfamily)
LTQNLDRCRSETRPPESTVPFLTVVTAEDVKSYKPGLSHFEEAVRRFATAGIQKSEILHVAQSKHHDMIPGRQFGLTTVWVNRRYGKKGTGATLAASAEPLVSYQINRQLSGWNLPPLVIRAFGAHCQ